MKVNKNVDTPYYIIDYSRLENNVDLLNNSFKSFFPDFDFGYSFKTNSLPWVLNYMKQKNAYAEVVSEPEYRLAKKIGYEKNKIILNGPYKGFKALEEALNDGAIVNLDSFHEIEWIKNHKPDKDMVWKVGLRINFDLEKECPNETVIGSEPGRFGFNIENGSYNKALEQLKSLSYVKITGIHGHNSTKTRSLKIFSSISKKIIEASEPLNYNIEYIDMGGGILGDKPGAPSFSQYAETIKNCLKDYYDFNKTKLIIEPGAALIASPVYFVCKALDTKQVKNTKIITTDGSCLNMDPQMHGTKFKLDIIGDGDIYSGRQIVCGYTCIEKDRMSEIIDGKSINAGDYLLFHNTGAYTMAMSPLFIQYYPSVMVFKDNTYYCIRDKWNVDDYIRKSYVTLDKQV